MKKSIATFLAIIICISSVFVACTNGGKSQNNDKKDNVSVENASGNADSQSTNGGESTTVADGLESNADNYIMDTVEVTDKNGKTVTDKNGNAVTEDIVYKEVTDKKGNTVAVQIDSDGNEVTTPKGDTVTSKINTTTKANTTTTTTNNIPDPAPENPISTVHTEAAKQPTEANLTTIKPAEDKVPKLAESGTPVIFSEEDALIVAQMLSVPHLYNASYENSESVPTNIAGHAAMWMAEREGLNTSIFASGTIVLDLFKFFGQTVVNFKTKCNNETETLKDGTELTKDYSLKYSSSNDTFAITDGKFEKYTHTVDNLSFYHLGNNNYYKVTGTVKGINGNNPKCSKVTAVIQRNKLDSDLGFSIKALKWE